MILGRCAAREFALPTLQCLTSFKRVSGVCQLLDPVEQRPVLSVTGSYRSAERHYQHSDANAGAHRAARCATHAFKPRLRLRLSTKPRSSIKLPRAPPGWRVRPT